MIAVNDCTLRYGNDHGYIWLLIHSQLKVYSLISYGGCSQKFQNLNFLHLFVASSQKYISPKEFSRNHFFIKLQPFLA